MMLPAFCDGCRDIYAFGLRIENCRSLTLKGTQAGPCPKCGHRGIIPDGIYNVAGDTLVLLSGPSPTVTAMTRLQDALQSPENQSTATAWGLHKIEIRVDGDGK